MKHPRFLGKALTVQENFIFPKINNYCDTLITKCAFLPIRRNETSDKHVEKVCNSVGF